jgi:hypothetical protein
LPELPRKDDKGHLSDAVPEIVKAYLGSALGQALPKQPVVIRNCENRTIAYKNGDGKTVYLTYVVNESFDEETVAKPRFNFKVGAARDLITGQKLDPAQFTVPPTDVRLVEFTVAGASANAKVPTNPRQAELQRLWLQGAQAKNRGDIAGARRAWQRMLAISPNHPGIKEALDKLSR